ncbi:hypothetical protein QJQ45_021028 [Haematococcus lacustris]|nr:hypothetical protein QJQ45_021028 [Haematococcus lacustris]
MIIRLGSDVEELREEVVKLNQTVASLRHELAIALGGSLPASPLRTAGLSNALECLLHFLADSPVHPEMQLPIVDAISFIWHCKKAGLAGNILPSKPLKPHHTREDMAHFYGGELMHDDGPIAGDFVMPSLRQCKEWGHTTGVYPRRDLRATFASNVAHYHAMKGVFTGFAMGRTTPAMNRALEFHAEGSTFNSVSHFPVVLKYEMPTDGSDPFAGIDEDEGDISGIIQFWQSIINELQAAGGWFM